MLQVRTKGNASPQGKRRVFFVCHPVDFERCFERICRDIFRTHDCAIYYPDNDGENTDDIESLLSQMNLFVIPISFRLLSEPNFAMDSAFAFSQKENIPVLPIMLETGIDALYTKKFGELQYLDINNSQFNGGQFDTTALSYEEKLKKYLESVLINDEMAGRVRAAFDAYIFLSYRKKDRRYANELMRLIHNNPVCRDIAIWYDEYLTPGENFNSAIEDAMNKSGLFALLVTPNLVIEENYVHTIEYPSARNSGKKILPVEMEQTDREELKKQYEGIPECVGGRDDDEFRGRLIESLSHIAKTENDNDDNHNFLIGLAYLDGIDVEKNTERAVKLIKGAANNGLIEAIDKMAAMYRSGTGVEINWQESLAWSERGAEAARREYGEKDPRLIDQLYDLAFSHYHMGQYSKSAALLEKIYEIEKELHGEKHPLTRKVLHDLALSYEGMGDYQKALEMLYRVKEAFLISYGEKDLNTLICMTNMALIYERVGDYREAVRLYEKSYESLKEIYGDSHQLTVSTLVGLAYAYSGMGNYQKALEIYERVYEERMETVGEKHPDTLKVLNNMSDVYVRQGYCAKGLEIHEKIYDICREVLGEKHPNTLTTLANIGFEAGAMGDSQRAHEALRKAYDGQKEILGPDHPGTLNTLFNIGLNYLKVGDLNAAAPVYEQVYAGYKRLYGENSEVIGQILSYLANIYEQTGDDENALRINEALYRNYSERLGENSPDTLRQLNNCAYIHGKLGDYQKACEIYRQVYEKCKTVFGEYDERTYMTLKSIAYMYEQLGDSEKALETFEEVYKAQENTLGKKHPETFRTLDDIVDLATALGDVERLTIVSIQKDIALGTYPNVMFMFQEEADKYLESGEIQKGLDAYETLYAATKYVQGENHADTVIILDYLAMAYRQTGYHEKALELFKLEYEKEKVIHGEKDEETLATLFEVGYTLEITGRYQDALNVYEKVYSGRMEILEEGHPDLQVTAEHIEICREKGKKP